MPGESIPLSSTEKEDRSPPDNVEEEKEDEVEKHDGGPCKHILPETGVEKIDRFSYPMLSFASLAADCTFFLKGCPSSSRANALDLLPRH